MSTHKRKHEDDGDVEPEVVVKQRRKRAASEPLLNQTEEPEKKEALKRLFGRSCSVNSQNINPQKDAEVPDDVDNIEIIDENDDPLLSDIPVNIYPEQLGFLVCAQETLRFLHRRGFSAKNPMFVLLRSRLIQGMNEIAAA